MYMEKDVIKMDQVESFFFAAYCQRNHRCSPLVTIIYLRLVGAQTLPMKNISISRSRL